MASNLSAYSPALSPSAPSPSPFFPPTPNPFFSAPANSTNIVLTYMIGVFGGLFLIAGVFIIDRLLKLCLGRVRRGQEDQSGLPLQSVAVIGTTRRSHFEEGVPLQILDKLTVRTYFRQHQKQQQALVSQPNATTENSTCSNIKPSPSMELLSKRCFDDKDIVICQDDSPACAVTTMTSETHGDSTDGTDVGMGSGHCTSSDQSATSPAAMVTAVESEEAQAGAMECQAVNIEDKDSQCTVCLLDYEDGELLRQLPCKHEFHKDCIDSWMCNHKTCPICRCEVV
ncbi:hypothetical protein CEUSTIGMA_g6086.t1 [Chlamydomonas eustigma]|uniref:RING-type domain-containing protein n=1 Tax=Chlamydomonas eustigma TaxID=1157962 RepID=A0A250X6E9_9CHLO|nr:hypothetical protein CEUSTIGMA_g6086.t1 [Chlamydomonas eustigma]|eukprot:GAX78648.1 hypothetical protein CEUSTIGMA_g6086.t1 [Chlamydomonas eustigma]